MDQNTPYVILLKIALMWNDYKKFDEGYLSPKTVILLFWKSEDHFTKYGHILTLLIKYTEGKCTLPQQ